MIFQLKLGLDDGARKLNTAFSKTSTPRLFVSAYEVECNHHWSEQRQLRDGYVHSAKHICSSIIRNSARKYFLDFPVWRFCCWHCLTWRSTYVDVSSWTAWIKCLWCREINLSDVAIVECLMGVASISLWSKAWRCHWANRIYHRLRRSLMAIVSMARNTTCFLQVFRDECSGEKKRSSGICEQQLFSTCSISIHGVESTLTHLSELWGAMRPIRGIS